MAKQKRHIDPEKIHLRHIEVLFADIGEVEDSIAIANIEGQVAHTSAYNISENLFMMGLQSVVKTVGLDTPLECKFRVDFHFEVDNLEEMFEYNEEDFPIFEELFVATLAGIAYSTFRGIIFEKTSGTPWNEIILPVLNPATILNSWIESE